LTVMAGKRKAPLVRRSRESEKRSITTG
jgi:hypothetical protein